LLLLLVVACASLVVPSIAASDTTERHVDGTIGANGWYVSNVHVYWVITPPPLSDPGCQARLLTTDGVTSFDCDAMLAGGGEYVDKFTVSVDKTAPAVHGVLSRQPDANGWYNKPVTVSFSGTDATSGIAGCSSATYSGPASANAVVSGSCTDKAGNVGQASVSFAYDSTPPAPVGDVTVKHGDETALLSWKPSADTKSVQVTRSAAKDASKVVYSGSASSYEDRGLRPGAKYKYTLTALDAASNSSTAETVDVTGTGRLIDPFPGESVASSSLRLFWVPVKGASYYNVQLIKGHKVLSAWPTRTSFKVPHKWVYHGHHYKLRHGVYRWYVWPGFGKRARAKYGRMLGSSTFRYAG
jgi:hypothetical protein